MEEEKVLGIHRHVDVILKHFVTTIQSVNIKIMIITTIQSTLKYFENYRMTVLAAGVYSSARQYFF